MRMWIESCFLRCASCVAEQRTTPCKAPYGVVLEDWCMPAANDAPPTLNVWLGGPLVALALDFAPGSGLDFARIEDFA